MDFLSNLQNISSDITNTFTYVEKFSSVMSTNFCDSICEELLSNTDWQKHAWDNRYKKDVPTTNADPDVTVFSNSELTKTIDLCIQQYTQKQKTRYLELGISAGWDIKQFSKPRWNKYSPGDNMTYHVDHIHSLFDDQLSKGIPVYSILGLVNSDFTGGDFMLCGKKQELQKGDILIWPSNFLYPHQVSSIMSGSRITFVSWAW